MMRRRAVLPIVVLAGLVSCDAQDETPPVAGLDVAVTLAGGSVQLDAVVVRIEGPTRRTETVQPGTTRTIDGLLPGSYSVAIEGLVDGEVQIFGETSGVTVTAGRNTNVSVSLAAFVPELVTPQTTAQSGQPVVVRFTPVTGAQVYVVEWSSDASFATRQSTESVSPNTTLPITGSGTYHLRGRARNRFGSVSRTGTPGSISVLPAGNELRVAGTGTGSGSVRSQPAGIDCTITAGTVAGACITAYAPGTTATLTAQAMTGSLFTGWGGACTGTGACTVSMTTAQAVSAAFAPAPSTFALSVAGAGTGDGRVVSSPVGINCTISSGTASGMCTAEFSAGATVNLTATASGGGAFTGWGGSCAGTVSCTLTMNQTHAVTASFDLASFELSVSGSGNETGRVRSAPSGIDCLIVAGTSYGTCVHSFAPGTAVTLTPISGVGESAYTIFEGWTGDSCTEYGPCTLVMNRNHSAHAIFNREGGFSTILASPLSGQVSIGYRAHFSAPSRYAARAEIRIGGTVVCSQAIPAGTQQYDAVCTFNSLAFPNGPHVFGMYLLSDGPVYGYFLDIVEILNPPAASTGAATDVTQTSANFTGSVDSRGSPYQIWFEWGTHPTLATYTATGSSTVDAGSSAFCLTSVCSWGLVQSYAYPSGTTVYFRIAASNAAGVHRGGIVSFITP